MSRKSNGEILKNGKKFIPLNIASVSSGFHREYLRQLIKKGKLVGERIGSSWFIAEDVFSSFIKNNPQAVSELQNKNYAAVEKKLGDLERKIENHDLYFNGVKNKSEIAANLIKNENNEIVKIVSDLSSKVLTKEDPWDRLLLGGKDVPISQKKAAEKISRFSFFPTFKKLALKILAVFLIVLVSNIFFLKNSELILAFYDNLKNQVIENYVRLTSSISEIKNLAMARISEKYDQLSYLISKNYVRLISSISKSADLASVAVSNQIIPSIRQTARLQLSNLENLTGFLTLESFENSILNSGKFVGWRLSQKKDILSDAKAGLKETLAPVLSPVKSAKTALYGLFQKLSGMPEIQPIRESQPPQFKAPQALSLREELDRLKSQGLEAEPSPAAQPAETERAAIPKTIERTIERIVSGITQTDLEATANGLNSKLLAEVESLKKLIEKRSGENFSAIALTNRINTLSGVTLTNPTISGTIGNLDDSMIPDNITVSNYLPLSGGTLSGLLSFPQSSSTRISVFDQIWIGGTSTTTLRGDGYASTIPYASTTALTVSGTASTTLLYVSGTATSTIAGLLNLTKVPTIAHNFSVWSLGMATSSLLNSSLLINPASAAADTVLFGIGVADASKFMVDAEGDIFANSLTSVGGQTLSSTTASTLLVENNTTLGDAIGDLVTFNSGNLVFSNRATSTIPNLTVNAWSIATSTSIIPTFTISTASSPFGFIGIGTTTPAYALDIYGTLRIDPNNGLIIPASSTPVLDVAGKIAIDTTSGQLKWYDGNKTQLVTGTTSPAFNLASTTMGINGKQFRNGTTTILLKNFPEAMTLNGFYCKATSTAATSYAGHLRFGDGSNWTEMGTCTTSGVETRTTTNNTFTRFEDFIVEASSTAQNAHDRMTITVILEKTAD